MLSSSSSPGPGWTVPNGFTGGRGEDATRLRAIGPFGCSNYRNGGAVWLGREGAFERCCDAAINDNKARYFILPPTVPHISRQRRQHPCPLDYATLMTCAPPAMRPAIFPVKCAQIAARVAFLRRTSALAPPFCQPQSVVSPLPTTRVLCSSFQAATIAL